MLNLLTTRSLGIYQYGGRYLGGIYVLTWTLSNLELVKNSQNKIGSIHIPTYKQLIYLILLNLLHNNFRLLVAIVFSTYILFPT